MLTSLIVLWACARVRSECGYAGGETKEEVGQDVDMNRRRLTDDDMKRLIKELSVLRERGLPTIDVDTQSKPRKEFPTLEALAWDYLSLNGRRERTRVRAIRALLEDAIGLIEEPNYRADALTLFLLDDANSTPDEARGKVVERGNRQHMDKRRRFGYEEEVRSILGERINNLLSSRVTERVDTPNVDELPLLGNQNSYINRDSLESKIRSSINPENHRCIVLYGEGGTGKTFLARKIVQDFDNWVWIAANRSTFMLDIYHTLKSRGLATEAMSEIAMKAEFSTFLASDAAPRIVVLDDVPDESFVEQIIPQLHVSTVIVTARRSLDLPTPTTSIRVGSLSDAEAMQMIGTLLSRASQDVKRQLAYVLQGWPLAIDQSARFLDSYPDVDIHEFCDELLRVPQDALELTGLPVAAFKAALGETVDRAAEDNSFSRSVLTFFATVHYQEIPTEFVALYLRVRKGLSASLSVAAANSALEFLERLALIERTRHGHTMHSLTHSVLRELMDGEIAEDDMLPSVVSVGYFLHKRWDLRVANEDDYDRERRHLIRYEHPILGKLAISFILAAKDIDGVIQEMPQFFYAFNHYVAAWMRILNIWTASDAVGNDTDGSVQDVDAENASGDIAVVLEEIVATVSQFDILSDKWL